MKPLLTNFRAIPPRLRWASLFAVALMLGILVWYFFLRATPGGGIIANPPPLRPALGKIVTLDSYRAAIGDALSEVRDAQGASGDTRKRYLESAATTLEGVEGGNIPLSGGEAVEIDNTALLEELHADTPDVDNIEAGLELLDSALGDEDRGSIEGTTEGGTATSTLRDVLSDPLFDYERDLSPLQRLARWLAGLTGEGDPNDTLWRWFVALIAALSAGVATFLASERLGNRWARLGLSLVAGLLTGLVFFVLLRDLGLLVQMLGAVGLIVAAIAVALVVTGLYRGSAPSAKPQAISELAAILGMNAAEARRRAEDAASEGDYRGAIRYRCLALLLALDERGKLHFDRAATNREYLFRAPGEVQNELQPLLARFDAVWYGGSPAGEAEWLDFAERAARVEGLIAIEAKAA